MRALFAPSIKLVNGLSYSRTFTTLLILGMAAVGFVLVQLIAHLNEEIAHSRSELSGLAVMKPLSELLRHLQQHRGLSAGAIGGDTAMKKLRPLRGMDVSNDLNALDGLMATELTGSAAWKKLRADWVRIDKTGMGLTAAENIATHSRLIDDLMVFQSSAADHYLLTRDPQIDSIYLIDMTLTKLPLVVERLALLRGIGAGVLASKQLPEASESLLRSLLTELAWLQKMNSINLEKLLHHNPALQAPLMRATEELGALDMQVRKVVTEELLRKNFSMAPSSFFTLASHAVDNGYRQISTVMFPALEGGIEQRLRRAQHELWASIGVVLLILALFAYIAIGAYYAAHADRH